MTLPFVEVSHLASSSSFYSAILQALGLRFLGADREHSSSIGTITYGVPAGATNPGSKQRKALTDGRGEDQGGQPVLQIREVTHPFEPVKLSTLVLAASSPAAVVEFHDAALTANPWLHIQTDGDPVYPGGPSLKPRLGIEGGETPRRATVRDLDGNTIQVVYHPSSNPKDRFGRVLEWNYNGTSRSTHTRSRSKSQPHPVTSARSSSSSVSNTQSPFQPRQQAPARRGSNTVTAAEMTQRAASRVSDDADQQSVSPRQSSNNNGLSTTTVVGALLGVAAGAALTYGFVNNATKERDRKPRQEFETPSLARRSTFPEKAPSVHKIHQEERRTVYGDYPPKGIRGGDYPPKALPYRPAGAYEPQGMPYPDGYPFRQPMHQEDYAPRKMSHPDDYPPRKLGYIDDDSSDDSPYEPSRPVHYLTEHPHEGEAARSTATRARSRSRPRSIKSTAKSTARSTAKSTRSAAKSTAKSAARSVVQPRARSRSRAPDDSYETTRSRRSSRHPPAEEVYEVIDTRSRHSSRHRPDDSCETQSRRSSRPPPTERARSVRSRSEAPASRKSVVLADVDRRSHAASRHSGVPKSSHSVARSHRPQYEDERTYFSARSRPSSRAPRRPPPPEVQTEIFEAPEVPEVPEVPLVPEVPRAVDVYEVPEVPDIPEIPEIPDIMTRSRAGSRFSVPRMATGHDYPGHMGYSSKPQSYISARNITLPMSGVGSSHAQWDDDMVSVAPSDSISCIGSKMSRRSRKVR